MASPNVDVVRSFIAAWERGELVSHWVRPEIEVVFADGPDLSRVTESPEILESWRAFLGTWEAEDYRELDDELVLVLAEFSGRGKRSGLEAGQIRSKGASLFHIRGGRVARLVIYWDRDRAVADLGLSPEGDAPSD